MGLDVYLYHETDEYKAARQIEDRHEKEMEEVGARLKAEHPNEENVYDLPEYQAASEDSRRRRFGDPKAWSHPLTKHVEIDSAKYPKHMFKIGYFRSSYNDGGINRVMSNAGILTLDEIFAVDREDYEIRPDWSASRRRAGDALASYQAIKKPLRCFFVGPNPFGQNEFVSSEAQAIDLANQSFKKHAAPNAALGDGWSNMVGHFFPGGMKVVAMIVGKQPFQLRPGHSEFGTYIVHEQDDEGRAWYEQALEIVIETCDYVLSKPDPERWILHWSG
jgi:hypothetical protein